MNLSFGINQGGSEMAVRIRLTRIGKKKYPHYKIVVTDSKKSAGNNYIEQLGIYNPNVDPAEFNLNEERLNYWLKVGAKPSETVNSLIKKQLN